MSRICGVLRPGWSKGETSSALDRLLAPLQHSPDFSLKRRCLDTVAFGSSTFSSLNFSTFLFASDDDAVMCAFSGYLFDPEILRKQIQAECGGSASVSDPAAMFAYLIPRHGARALANLSGCFTFALWEGRSKTLTLGTDRFGMMPLYYQQKNGRLTFASEIKSLLSFDADEDFNGAAFSELLALGAPLGDHTLYPSVKRLPAASVMTCHETNATIAQYWTRGTTHHDPRMTLPDFVEEAQRLLARSVARLAAQIANPICFLSGGYDSRRLLLELAGSGKPVTACTSPTVRFDNPWTCDVPIARALCAELGVRHITAELPPATSYGDLVRHSYTLLDFETDSHPWVLPLLSIIPVGSGVNFDGLGGDVLFEYNFTYADEAARMDDPAYLTQRVLRRFPDIWNLLLRFNPPEPSLAERIEAELRRLPDDENRLGNFYFGNWTRRKASLFAHGLLSLKIDTVYPYLDYKLVDHVFRLPPLVRRTAEVSKAMLDRMNPGLMSRVPTSHDKRLTSGDDPFYQPFRDRLPEHFWLDTQASINRAAAEDIFKAKDVWSHLTRKTQLCALANCAVIPKWCLPREFPRISWRLRMAGLYALQRRKAHSSHDRKSGQATANAYVYGRS